MPQPGRRYREDGDTIAAIDAQPPIVNDMREVEPDEDGARRFRPADPSRRASSSTRRGPSALTADRFYSSEFQQLPNGLGLLVLTRQAPD